MGSPFLGAVRLAAYLAFTLALIPVQAAALAVRSRLALTLPLFYHRACTRIFGFRLDVAGRASETRPVLFASNHSSYLDIMVLGALIPGSFVAKAEVAGWPLFGLLAKLQRTVFVERRASQAARHRDGIAERLAAGDALILFPEGTSSDGNRTLPFKSALFAATRADGRDVEVQPVSITCTALDGIPLTRHLRPVYAWYGDMGMVRHIWTVACLGRLTISVRFHQPVTAGMIGSRKALAEHCRRQVAAGVEAANSGRPLNAAA
jgi:1-acyl-sn-glycerol-3-phosphate acyltransferase